MEQVHEAMEGLAAPLNPPRGTCIAAENSVSSVKVALAALCIFRTRKKTLSLSVSVFKIKSRDSNNITYREQRMIWDYLGEPDG